MNLIGIETSTENCSVGLLHDGHITTQDVVAPQKHAELVLGFIDALLQQQNLSKSAIDGIVFGQGPGAFTGVRIAFSVVQGLALAWRVPVLGISTMHNMAHQLAAHHADQDLRILIANDARMGEVYWATFRTRKGQLERLTADALDAPENINTSGFDVCMGSAFQQLLPAPDEGQTLADGLPNAQALLGLAQNDFMKQSQPIHAIEPNYIREKVVFN